MNGELLSEARQLGTPTIKQVKDRLNQYLGLAQTDKIYNPHLSEYVGPQMLGPLQRYVLDRFFSGIASTEFNAGHGYDEDPISLQVHQEIKELTNARGVALVLTGTGANLNMIASFTGVESGNLSFIACQTEHTVTLEGDMLTKAGIKPENMTLLPSPTHDGIIHPQDLIPVLDKTPNKFIFQMAIPSNEGVVPSIEELQQLIELVHDRGGYFLVDGARLANALVHWDVGLDALTKLGVDAFTLGTSKKGGMAEVVCINHREAAQKLPQEVKAFGHVSSKGSPLALVTGIMLTTDYWRQEAGSENQAASLFTETIRENGINPEFDVCANTVFIAITEAEQKLLAANPDMGELYRDYGPNADIARVTFTGFQSEASVKACAEALIKVRQAIK